MTILTEELKDKGKDYYRVVLVPTEHLSQNGAKWTYDSWNTLHPVSNELTSYLIANNGDLTQLYSLDKVNWKNYTVKNLASTPDGKPYRCLFITQKFDETNIDQQEDIPAIVLGTLPDIYVMTPFSPLYFLLAYFKNILQKSQNDNETDSNRKRLLSYEDMLDSICENDEKLNKLVNHYKIDIKKYIQQICEIVSVPSMDSDDESEPDEFYKPSMGNIIEFLHNKIEKLTEMLAYSGKFKSLEVRMQTMFATGKSIPDEVKLELWRKQAITLVKLFADEWYITETIKKYGYIFERMEKYTEETEAQLRAQDVLNETLEDLHQGTAGASTKRVKQSKSTAKTSTKKVPVKVKTGALDMFFKKKEN
jgi:hypothetical protein